MSAPQLKYRTRFPSSLRNELGEKINKLSQETRLQKTTLMDEAVEDLLMKYHKEAKAKTRKSK